MTPEIVFESATPRKVNSANLPSGKMYLEIETLGKNHNQGTPGLLHPYPCADEKWNSPIYVVAIYFTNKTVDGKNDPSTSYTHRDFSQKKWKNTWRI